MSYSFLSNEKKEKKKRGRQRLLSPWVHSPRVCPWGWGWSFRPCPRARTKSNIGLALGRAKPILVSRTGPCLGLGFKHNGPLGLDVQSGSKGLTFLLGRVGPASTACIGRVVPSHEPTP